MQTHMTLEVYIAGDKEYGKNIVENLKKALDESNTTADIKLINVLDLPEQALENNIYATPTLRKIFPEPVVKVLADASKIANALILVTNVSD